MQENYKNEYKSGEIELSIPSMIKTVYVKHVSWKKQFSLQDISADVC